MLSFEGRLDADNDDVEEESGAIDHGEDSVGFQVRNDLRWASRSGPRSETLTFIEKAVQSKNRSNGSTTPSATMMGMEREQMASYVRALQQA